MTYTIEQRENLMDMVVTVKYMNGVVITGKVVDFSVNGEYIHIENDEDYYMIDLQKVELSENKQENKEEKSVITNYDKLENFMEENGYSFIDSGVMEDDGSVDYINGFTYEVMVFIPNDGNSESFYLETIHKGRKKEYSDDSDNYTANRQYRKTWKGFENILRKYLEA